MDKVIKNNGRARYGKGTVYFTIMGCSRSKDLVNGSILNDPICASCLLKVDYDNAKHEDTILKLTKDGVLEVQGRGSGDVANVLKPSETDKLTLKQRKRKRDLPTNP